MYNWDTIIQGLPPSQINIWISLLSAEEPEFSGLVEAVQVQYLVIPNDIFHPSDAWTMVLQYINTSISKGYNLAGSDWQVALKALGYLLLCLKHLNAFWTAYASLAVELPQNVMASVQIKNPEDIRETLTELKWPFYASSFKEISVQLTALSDLGSNELTENSILE
ncbi:hypothetical protein BDR04DRAFT_1118325 [Suillus decipiens]|nr:hypothetical protein BDR04DRAFT_1118325 [Suillus decipiens]